MEKKFIVSIVVGVLIVFMISSCLPETKAPDYNALLESSIAKVNQTKLQEDIMVINDSLNKWIGQEKITRPVFTDSKNAVRYTIQTAGPTNEIKPTLASYIVVNYKGKRFSDGVIFDQSQAGQPLGIYLHQLIIGWQTTLPLLTKGTKATLYIPSGYAYGSKEFRDNNGNITIPSNSILIFEIEIVGVY